MSQENQKVIWQAESTDPDLAERTREALREVMDPEIGLNIIELGLVRDLIIEDKSAQLNMILTTPFCPYGPALIEVTRVKAENVLERPTTVELSPEMWDPTMMEEGAGSDWGFF
jgi:metal-sulfur cluster biosynthetic enzyme